MTVEPQLVTTSVTADGSLFRPMRMGNASEETMERLFRSIRSGVVETGQRLPSEREPAERLGLGRVTDREATRALAGAGRAGAATAGRSCVPPSSPAFGGGAPHPAGGRRHLTATVTEARGGSLASTTARTPGCTSLPPGSPDQSR